MDEKYVYAVKELNNLSRCYIEVIENIRKEEIIARESLKKILVKGGYLSEEEAKAL